MKQKENHSNVVKMSQIISTSFYTVYLPENYDRVHTFPVIYCFHGGHADSTVWFTDGYLSYYMDEMISKRKLPPSIVICPNAGELSWYNQNVQDYFTYYLFPFLEYTFRIKKSAPRYLIGCSMGGYGALLYSLNHPKMFQKVFLISIACPDDHCTLLSEEIDTLLSKKYKSKYYLFCGKEDFVWNKVQLIYKLFKTYNIPVKTYFGHGTHNWSSFRPFLFQSLKIIKNDLFCTGR